MSAVRVFKNYRCSCIFILFSFPTQTTATY